jgi:predicted NUDIX family NTP pyrophosphohydrolase
MSKQSAGILLFRRGNGRLQVLLVHPGGPFWAKKDEGAWSIPKGLIDEGESPLAAARREFQEETGFSLDSEQECEFMDLGALRQPNGKIVRAFALEKDLDETKAVSNKFSLEWPKGSGLIREYPEIDRAGWFDVTLARKKILKGQAAFLDRLIRVLNYEEGDMLPEQVQGPGKIGPESRTLRPSAQSQLSRWSTE